MQQEAIPAKGIFGAAWIKFKKEIAALENENKTIFVRARYNQEIELAELQRVAQRIYEQMLPIPGLIGWMHEPGRAQYYLYRHGIDVALIAGLTGIWLEQSPEEVQELVFAGLVHDIGKACVPFSIISKPTRLDGNEEHDAHDHVLRGWEMLRAAGEVRDTVLDGVLQHHERIDGSGYPNGSGAATHSLSGRILAVADVYDALVSNRYYRRGMSPFEAMQLMSVEMEAEFDPQLRQLMFKKLAEGLIGRTVRLHDGRTGVLRLFEYGKGNQPILEMNDDAELLQLGKMPQFSLAELVYA